ncbi:PilX N-terminal domain-containing pilus assembly protein [Methylomicrobium lacus]|uniref:pilus assembly PilX family protein n=1 Tax=Methylomicrobium lacus TaxID=136992 RepID=UPI0035A8BDAF
MKISSCKFKPSQKGAATLIVVLVLAMVMGIIALTTARTGLMEQKITGNDLRAREALEAAEAGLEYGTAWAGKHNVPWPSGANTLACPATGCPTLPQVTGTSTGEAYNVSALVYSRPGADSEFIHVRSTATGASDASISGATDTYIKPGSLLTKEGKLPPPLVMDGCMTSTTGTPDIYPNWHDLDGDGSKDANEWVDANGNGVVDSGEWTDANGNGKVDNELERSIMTSKPENVGGNFCLNYCGPGGGCDPTSAGTGRSHLDLHNGLLQNNTAYPHNSLWDYYFQVSQAQFKAAASATLSTDPGLYWVSSTGNWAGGTYGSAADPVMIVFEHGCPKPNGNTTIYGILFFLEVDGCVTDPMNGWGNVTVYGSLGVNGGVKKMNANLEIHGVGDGVGMQTINSRPINASRLPGTWKDF